MTRISALHLVFFLFLLALASCGQSRTLEHRVTPEEAAADSAQRCASSMKDVSITFSPEGSPYGASGILATMKASNGTNVSLSRSPMNGVIRFSGKVSSGLKYQFKINSNTLPIYTSEVIDPKSEPTFQGCGVVRNCNYQSGKVQCSTPL